MKSIESAYNTLRNAEIDYRKNQIADPALAEEMADAENDSHKKKFGIGPSDDKLMKGRKAAFERGVEILAEEAEKMSFDIKNVEVRKRENRIDGELVSFEYGGHIYEFDHLASFQQDGDVSPDYFQLVSVDGSGEFSDEEEKIIVQKFETVIRMKLNDAAKQP